MNRLFYALLIVALCFTTVRIHSQTGLPVGSAPDPITFTHFPSRLHAFVWRNWSLVPVERLASVVDTSSENIHKIASAMGLTEQNLISPEHANRSYITLIRRNWHLLPYEQLLELLNMTADELAHSLREDDFLFVKLGNLKPDCVPLTYTPPTETQIERSAQIKALVDKSFPSLKAIPQEERFHFIQQFQQAKPTQSNKNQNARFSPRYAYSYFALYGDSLMDPNLESYPEGLFQQLAEMGVDGIWIHSVLRQMAPSTIYPVFGQDHEIRIENLNKLVKRAEQFGLKIYLYVNEPRAMRDDFFANREDIRGVPEGEFFAMCTSNENVRQWISDSMEYIFTEVPNLGGAFTISASENQTNCASHGKIAQCPRCSKRTPAEVIAEVNTAIATGVHRGNPDAKVIVWDWGWRDEWATGIIPALPKSVWFMSVSEWSKPISRGNVNTQVGEYSISVVGPGPRAQRHWGLAKEAGLKTMAKMQINNTWELSAVPYLPVMDLIAQHCENLLQQEIDGMMLSWTLGGYPSPNMNLVDQFGQSENITATQALDALAEEYFGKSGMAKARQAWTQLSQAFQKYPYHGSVLYTCPVQYGPSNLLYPQPTGYTATMVGLPYDDLTRWRGPYPTEVFYNQFDKLSQGWATGLQYLAQAVELAPEDKQALAQEQLRFAQAAHLHFQSVANQTRFTDVRNTILNNDKSLNQKDRDSQLQAMEGILNNEIALATQLLSLTSQDSRIGFEASNHYYYLPLDLIEKVINCQYIIDHLQDFYQSKDE